MESGRKNMVITYDSEKDAKRTRDTLEDVFTLLRGFFAYLFVKSCDF